jgi:type IV secretory pathway VirB10-like protein
MNEIEEVKVVPDSGSKRKWGRLLKFYRQDGRKNTIKSKYVLYVVLTVFAVSCIFVLIKGPAQSENKDPISFNGVVSSVSTIEVPPAELQNSTNKKISNNGYVVKKYSGLEVVSRPLADQIPPGSLVKAVLVTGGSNGLVKAKLLEPLSSNGETLIESGCTLVGTGSSTEDRLNISFSKIVNPDGKVVSVKAQACDAEDQIIGVKGSKLNQYGMMLAAGVGLNFASGLAEGLQDSDVKGGVEVKKNDLKNAALNGAAKASIETSKEIIEKWKQQKIVIEVKKGTEICVIFESE